MSAPTEEAPANIKNVKTSQPARAGLQDVTTVVAFDPGVAHMGVAVLLFCENEGHGLSIFVRYSEQFTTPSDMPIERRLDAVAKRIAWVFASFVPDVVAWENVVAVSAGKDGKGGSSSNGGRIKEVSGMIRMACELLRARSYILMPATYRKLAFGKGRSRGKTKKDLRGVIEQFLDLMGLTLDESEAFAMALLAYAKWRVEE